MNEIKYKFMQVEQELKRQEKLIQQPKISLKAVLLTAIEFLTCASVIVFAIFCLSPDEEIIKLFLFLKELFK